MLENKLKGTSKNSIRELHYYLKNQKNNNEDLKNLVKKILKSNDIDYIKEELTCLYFLNESPEIRSMILEYAKVIEYQII